MVARPTGRNWVRADQFGERHKAFLRCLCRAGVQGNLPRRPSVSDRGKRLRGRHGLGPDLCRKLGLAQAGEGHPSTHGGAMVLSSAERQRRYIARIRAGAAASNTFRNALTKALEANTRLRRGSGSGETAARPGRDPMAGEAKATPRPMTGRCCYRLCSPIRCRRRGQ
jgi:hypothetical protein